LFANEVKDMDRYRKETIWMYGDFGPRVLDRYPVGPEGPAYAIAANFTDQRFACPSQALRRQLARYVPVWGYEFADRGAPFILPDWLVGLDFGAYHASELAYVFGTSWIFADVKRFTPQQKALSQRIQSLWARFGRDDFEAEWPRVEGAGPVRVFAPDGDRLDPDFFGRHHCDFWDGGPFGAVH
jgi:para-nitrobenzyl esterase